jgi:hypothetical protein
MAKLNGSRTGIRLRLQIGLALTFIGLMVYLLGADPGLFNLDRSPIIGIVQILVFLFGLGVICIGGYITMSTLWNGYQKTIAADIGLRLVSTGFVIAVASGLADVIGFGSHPPPLTPSMGNLQALGVLVGEIVIALGFLLLVPFRPLQPKNQ